MNNYKTYLATWQRRFGDSTTATITRYAFGIREHVDIVRLDQNDYQRRLRRLVEVQNNCANYADLMPPERLAELMNEERQLKLQLLR